MKRWFTPVVVAMMAVTGAAYANDDTQRADAFIALLRGGDFGTAHAQFDTTMSKALSEAKLRQTWNALEGQVGSFQKTTSHRQTKHGELVVVDAMSSFTRADLAIRVVFNPKGQVSGLFFLPPDKALPASMEVRGAKGGARSHASPSYVKPGSFTTHEVTVGKKPWQLDGILTVPRGEGPFPGVVLVAGSGPNDKDETIGPNKPFKELAEGLSSSGIAVLRYDKRTHAHGAQMDIPKITVEEEVLADARAAIELLRAHDAVDRDRVFVLGHSLGGTLAPVIESDAPVAGAVILAGSARPLTQVMIEQLDYIGSLPTHQSSDEQKTLNGMKKQLHEYQAGKLGDDTLVFGASVHYLKDLEARKPLEKARRSKVPYLVLQGGRDYQVTKDDFDLWKKALRGRDDATFKYYPDLNHLFAKGKGMATPEEYAKPKSVALEVVQDIAAWVNTH